MTQQNNDQFLSMTRTLDRYASKYRLFPHHEYTSCVVKEYVDMQDHSYTFCIASYSENTSLFSLSRCSSSDTPSRIKGQNQAGLNLNKGDVVVNYENNNTIGSFTFFDAEEEEDTVTISNIDKLGNPILHTRHVCYLLALSYSLARDYNRNGDTYFSIYNIPNIVTAYLSEYFKFEEREYKENLNRYEGTLVSGNIQDNQPPVDVEIEYWEHLDFVPFALTFVRYAFYYYKCMIVNLESSDTTSLNEYVYNLWLHGCLDHPNEITVPYSESLDDQDSDSMH